MPTPPPTGDRPIRVSIVEPGLAKYRVPVFRELARRPGIEPTVIYGERASLPNVAPDGFKAVATGRYRYYPGDKPSGVFWNPAHTRYASRALSDVLVMNWDLHGASLIPALLKARACGVGTVIWGHGYSKRGGGRGLRTAARNLAPRLSDSVLFYTRAVADAFVEAGFPRDRVFAANNALDQTSIDSARRAWLGDPDRLRRWQAEHDLADRPVVLFVSRLERDNRVGMLLDASAMLAAEMSQLRTIVIGKGEALEELRAQAARLGIAERVRFAGAIYDEMELAPYFLTAGAFCYPSNIGLSCLHALGYGLPVVTSDDPAEHNPEFAALGHDRNALLYRSGSVSDLAAALRRVLGDQPLRQRLSSDALRTVAEEFSLGAMVDGLEAAIRHAAARRGRG